MTAARTAASASLEPLAAAPPEAGRAQAREAFCWAAVLAGGAAVTAALVVSTVELDTSAPPFLGSWEPRPTPLVVVPLAVAVAVLLGSRTATRRRLPWPWLLVAGYLTSLAWTLALAVASVDGTVALPSELMAQVDRAGDDPVAYLDLLTGPAAPGGTQGGTGRPPGSVLLLGAARWLGVDGRLALGLLLTALGAAVVPLVGVAVRSLCHETAARRLVPVLALAPWAVWSTASPEAVTAAVAAAGVAVGVVGCEPGRRPWWALASGLLLGVTGLFGFSAPWLGTAVAATYFVRRRPLLNVITGTGALVPFFAVYAAGFSWPESLGAARRTGLTGTDWPTWVAWVLLDLVVVAAACGPVAVRATRRVRLTPGWPFLLGAGAAALFSLTAGLARGGVEQSWLPLLPWLLVPAVAPRPRPVQPGDTVRAGELPLLLVAVGATAAVALSVCLAPASPVHHGTDTCVDGGRPPSCSSGDPPQAGSLAGDGVGVTADSAVATNRSGSR